MKIYDISPVLHAGVAVWPGDTPFARTVSLRLERGDSVELSDIRLSLHTGSHADAPSHFQVQGVSIDRVDLEAYWGLAQLATVPGTGEIRPAMLDPILAQRPERLLLRAHPDFNPNEFPRRIRHLNLESARRIGEAGVRLLGIDAPSVDPLNSKTLAAHKQLERGGTRILENLWYGDAPDGRYELSALPLKIEGGDASPVRAALRELAPGRE